MFERILGDTNALPKTNIAPENRPYPKRKGSSSNPYFSGLNSLLVLRKTHQRLKAQKVVKSYSRKLSIGWGKAYVLTKKITNPTFSEKRARKLSTCDLRQFFGGEVRS